MPKFKKFRQWSQDSLASLSQLANRSTSTDNSQQTNKVYQHPPTQGITTISAAINEHKIDPKRDNFGLYALKCDRSRSAANAKRGILLNLPSTSKIKAKVDSNFHSVERNHEIFKPCETSDDNPSKLDVMTQPKVEAPPRKKKRIAVIHHQNQQQHQQVEQRQIRQKQQLYNRADQSIVPAMDSVERNDSGLYKIIAATETAKITFVEPKEHLALQHRKERSIAVVRPKVEKAITVKSSVPVSKQIAKVKDYEWNKNQRKSSIKSNSSNSSTKKEGIIKKFQVSHSLDSYKSSEKSIDIFKANRLSDQKKLFDEFDELFEKNRRRNSVDHNEKNNYAKDPTPESAFEKLNELKKSSMAVVKQDESFNDRNEKPKIVSEQIKPSQQEYHQHQIPLIKKKIIYYDDERELKEQLLQQRKILKQQQTNEIAKLSTMDIRDYDVNKESTDKNGNQASIQQQQGTAMSTFTTTTTTTQSATFNATKSNSLRIFSNDGIFVFNL
jgi:hypothetical protein